MCRTTPPGRTRLLALTFLCAAAGLMGVLPASAKAECPCNKKNAFDYGDYERVLNKYVDEDGMVAYGKLKANRGRLDRFVRSLGALKKSTYRGWSTNSKIAFLINAYNAITLKIVIDNHPIKSGWLGSLRWPKNSIRQIDGAFDGIRHRVMGREMTLDDIEHETLRKEFNEPRIHLALVCAAMSCPRLLAEPYVGDLLVEQFAVQAQHFVRQPDNFRIDRGRTRVFLSEIFKWFGEDFIKTHGTRAKFAGLSEKNRAVLNYLKEHLRDEDRLYLLSADYGVKYLDYDWTLNER